MEILDQPRKKSDLTKAQYVFDGPMIKAVVDVKRQLIGIDAELHADLEKALLENGSSQDELWGINLYPEDDPEDFVEFDSMINIRPRSGNRTRTVESPELQQRILTIVHQWIQ